MFFLGDGRLDFEAGTVGRSDDMRDFVFEQHLGALLEFHHPAGTRQECRVNEHGMRVATGDVGLDRIYTKLEPLDVLDAVATASAWRRTTEVRACSDHIPLSVTFRAPRTVSTRSAATPVWIARDERFFSMVRSNLYQVQGANAHEQLHTLVDVAAACHGSFLRSLANRTAETYEKVLHLVALAYRVERASDGNGVRNAVRAYPALASFVCESSGSIFDFAGFSALLASCHRRRIDREQAQHDEELEREPTELGKDAIRERQKQRRAFLVQQREAWSLKRRGVCLGAVFDPNGRPAKSPSESAEPPPVVRISISLTQQDGTIS